MHLANMKRARPFQAIAALVEVLGNDKRVLIRPEGQHYDPTTGQSGHPLLRSSPALVYAYDDARRITPIGAVSAAHLDNVYLSVSGQLDADHVTLARHIAGLEAGRSVACTARFFTARPCEPDPDGIVRLIDWRLTGLLIDPAEPTFQEARIWLRDQQATTP